jgi:hypothetical protein
MRKLRWASGLAPCTAVMLGPNALMATMGITPMLVLRMATTARNGSLVASLLVLAHGSTASMEAPVTMAEVTMDAAATTTDTAAVTMDTVATTDEVVVTMDGPATVAADLLRFHTVASLMVDRSAADLLAAASTAAPVASTVVAVSMAVGVSTVAAEVVFTAVGVPTAADTGNSTEIRN